LRDGQEKELDLPTTAYNGKETTEVIGWQGMVVQEAYAAAKEQVQKHVPDGVYVSCCLLGSPAQATLNPGIWITEINQIPVKSLKDFLNVVTNKRHSEQLNKASPVIKLGRNASLLLASPTIEESKENLLFSDDNQSHIQIKFETTANITQVKAIKLDRHYWPTWHLQKDESSIYGWDTTFY
jgi:PDZ domain-containing secreted protein